MTPKHVILPVLISALLLGCKTRGNNEAGAQGIRSGSAASGGYHFVYLVPFHAKDKDNILYCAYNATISSTLYSPKK